MDTLERALATLRARQAAGLESLREFLRIPTISADPAYWEKLVEGAQWVAEHGRRIGLKVEFFPGETNDKLRPPIVVLTNTHQEGRKKVVFYGHYDVQPAEPLDKWSQPDPFAAVERDGKLYARGATDDKGPVMAFLWAVEALLAENALDVNLVVVLEGQEEAGSKWITEWVRSGEGRAVVEGADVLLISDTAMAAPNVGTLCYGLRGMAFWEVLVKGPDKDLHSGTFGGAVENPAMVLSRILAQLKGASGLVAVPGFYDAVQFDQAEASRISAMPLDPADVRRDSGAPQLMVPDAELAMAMTAQPTLEINGLTSGYQGDGPKTIIPSWARAKISVRTVPNMIGAEVLEQVADHIRSLAPDTVTVEVTPLHWGPWVMVDPAHSMMALAAETLQEVFGTPAAYLREGGSIPLIAHLQEATGGAPAVLMGWSLHSDNLHSPDEHVTLGHLFLGSEVMLRYLIKLASA